MLLTIAGLHVPVILFVDVNGKAGTVPPEQIARAVPKLNVGVRFGFTVILTVTGKAHKPAVGVNVYEPLVVLLTVEGRGRTLTGVWCKDIRTGSSIADHSRTPCTRNTISRCSW